MARLSLPIGNLKDHYSVVVIGSGYGGGIAASRLARAGQKVCVLERGREFQPGEYPDTLMEMMAEVQIDTPRAKIGSRTGLYDLHLNDDMNVFSGCGLGGTSLVNANVSLPAEPRVLEDPRWPLAFRQDLGTRLKDGYERAKEMLKPVPYPKNAPELPKLHALEKSAAAMGQEFYRPPINVTFKDGVNHVGVPQQACKLCGDCVSGCNHAAKNTVLMNYLPDAFNHGAEIFTQVGVGHLERKDNRWFIHYQFLDSGREKFKAPTLFLTADLVVLAAGVLGTAEILLRSKAAGLKLSDQLGQRFTGNGDVLAFSYDGKNPVSGIGFGDLPPKDRAPVGPCITGIIDIRKQTNLDDGMVIEEGSIPGALGPLIPAGLSAAAPWAGEELAENAAEFFEERAREWESAFLGPYHGAVRNTQTYLVMTHDDGAGRLVLEEDRVRIQWPGVGAQPIFQKVNDRLKEATVPMGGVFLKNPLWSEINKHNLTTVHPLGGCVMAENAAQGVVNHKGQAFNGSNGTSVHDSLYVCDGSVIPRPLGVNPLLTISAVAERCCALMATDRGWQIKYNLPSKPKITLPPVRMGLRFTETMRGFFSTKVLDDFAKGREQGQKDKSAFEFTLSVVSDDLEEMLTKPEHKARMVGTVTAPVLSAKPMTVSDGSFQLLVKDPDRVNARLMVYNMTMTSEEGKTFVFEGFKVVKDDPAAFEIWSDTSTLYITVREGNAPNAVLGKGIVQIMPQDFLNQITTTVITNAPDAKARLNGLVRFGTFFAGAVFDIYGGVIARANEFRADAVPRKKRPLRLPAPEVHYVETEDHVQVRLTRYQGGKKGPVLVAPGYGTSTLAYTIDTVDTNLPEYLCAQGYDVWLFDYRASPELPSSKTQFTLDDVATKDYPAVAARVREVTGAATIQAMVHCVGSMTFLMAMLSGKLTGIRSAVCSSLTLFPVSPPENQIKAAFNIGQFLKALGRKTVTTDFNSQDWKAMLADAVLKLNANGPPCNSAVCRRIWTIYGNVYKHDNLNDATHQAIHEMFGIGNIAAFNHILQTIRSGKVVDKDGQDVYMPNLARLKFPITFLHGAQNNLFLPEGSDRSFKLLTQKNGAEGYKRIVLPNYAHMDMFIGRNAAQDVFPLVAGELDEFN